MDQTPSDAAKALIIAHRLYRKQVFSSKERTIAKSLICELHPTTTNTHNLDGLVNRLVEKVSLIIVAISARFVDRLDAGAGNTHRALTACSGVLLRAHFD